MLNFTKEIQTVTTHIHKKMNTIPLIKTITSK